MRLISQKVLRQQKTRVLKLSARSHDKWGGCCGYHGYRGDSKELQKRFFDGPSTKLVGRFHRVEQREKCGIPDVRGTTTDIHALKANNFSNLIPNSTTTTQQNSYSVPYFCIDLSHARLLLYHGGDHNAARKTRASRARDWRGWRMFFG